MIMSKIEKLVLGTVQFGLNYGINNTSGKPSEQQVEQILCMAYDRGIRCLDSAEAYGDSHSVIGNFHSKHPEKKFDIITKMPHNLKGDLVDKIKTYVNDLNVNSLKSILFHSYETFKQFEDKLPLLNEYKQKGLFETIGVSVYTNAQVDDVLKNNLIKVIQLPFNLLDNANLRQSALQRAKDAGKTIHTRSAYLQGLFFMPPGNSNDNFQSLSKEIFKLRNIAEQSNIDMQTLALSYCLNQQLIDNVLIGVDNLQQLKQNLEVADFQLPENVIAEINTIFVNNPDLLNPSLWN